MLKIWQSGRICNRAPWRTYVYRRAPVRATESLILWCQVSFALLRCFLTASLSLKTIQTTEFFFCCCEWAEEALGWNTALTLIISPVWWIISENLEIRVVHIRWEAFCGAGLPGFLFMEHNKSFPWNTKKILFKKGWKWMKVDESGWKWMNVDENGWNWVKVDESGWKWITFD